MTNDLRRQRHSLGPPPILRRPAARLGDRCVYVAGAGTRAGDRRTLPRLFSFGVVLYEMTHPAPSLSWTHDCRDIQCHSESGAGPAQQFQQGPSSRVGSHHQQGTGKESRACCQSAAELRADLKRLQRLIESSPSTPVASAPKLRTGVAAKLPSCRDRSGSRNTRHLCRCPSPIWRSKKCVAQREARATQYRRGASPVPSWSQDGSQVAYVRDVNGRRKVFIQPVSGEPKQLTNGDADEIQPAWTPDDKAILFVRANQPGLKLEPGDIFGSFDNGDLWKRDLQSGSEELLLSQAFHPAFYRRKAHCRRRLSRRTATHLGRRCAGSRSAAGDDRRN